MNYPTNPPQKKRQKMSLFDTSRARNGGNPTSFLTTSTTGIMDTTHDSSTDEEDNADTEQHYLDQMTDDTDRKVETVFGKGVDVWKSFNGTIYADVNDRIKKQRRDEEVWGKKKEKEDKRKRKRATKGKQDRSLQQRYDSLQTNKSKSESVFMSGSASTPSLTHSTYTAGTVSSPSLPSSYGMQLPRTPTASEWEVFPVRQSQCEDLAGTPLVYRSLDETGERRNMR